MKKNKEKALRFLGKANTKVCEADIQYNEMWYWQYC